MSFTLIYVVVVLLCFLVLSLILSAVYVVVCLHLPFTSLFARCVSYVIIWGRYMSLCNVSYVVTYVMSFVTLCYYVFGNQTQRQNDI